MIFLFILNFGAATVIVWVSFLSVSACDISYSKHYEMHRFIAHYVANEMLFQMLYKSWKLV